MASSAGLTAEQVAQLRDEVGGGRAPRVQVSGAQFGGTTSGTVRAVGDPAVDGDDFVTVRVRVDGVTDDLRFAPRELTRGRAAKKAPPAAQQKAAASRSPAASRPAAPRAAAAPRSAKAPRQRRAAAAAPTPAPVEAPAKRAAPAKPPRRGGSLVPVSIVLTSKDATWTVSARRGARTVVKAAPVSPGVVSAVAGLLDQPALEEAVAGINDSARAEAEARAETLRAELAAVQAVLDGHRLP